MMAKFQHHIFICTNERAADNPKGCCTAKGSAAVAKAFKIGLHGRGLRRIVRANPAGCLDQCGRGATVVVYPEGSWYGGVCEADVEEIIEEHIVGGRVVERLLLAPEELTGRAGDGAPGDGVSGAGRPRRTKA
ncbi:MAG: (2Fe-2S) ferredoxin domain-containing protein [Planctomycetota bacterium]|nr:(2Fe-2S) ferredoxin domain-containing protein [Planctomycetota bacterium]MDP6837537.1 (2Fe-2S) ferredoxin domain-containing protein [Planctomycetota bacterium]